MWPDQHPTEELLIEVRGGDAEAVNRLLEQHRDAVRRLVRMRLDQRIQQRVDVSDVVQEVMVEAHRRLRDYLDHPVLSFRVWLRQIAKDRIIDAHRRHRQSAKRSVDRERPAVAAANLHRSTLELAAQLQDPELTPAAAAAQRELVQRVEAAITQLNEQDAEIVVMRHYERLTNQEIAQALNLSEPAASMRYLRAVRRLRELLDGSDSLPAKS
jgi:RNA polymerase sigma-70 factor, ECF subfamily